MTIGERNALQASLRTADQADLERIEREAWQLVVKLNEEKEEAVDVWCLYREEIRRRIDDARILETAKKLANQMVTAEVQA